MSDLKLNKAGGFDSIDDATNQLGGLGARSIGAVADSGKAAQPKDAQKWDRDYESVKKLSDTLPHPNTTFTPYSDEKAEAMKLYGVEPKVKEEQHPYAEKAVNFMKKYGYFDNGVDMDKNLLGKAYQKFADEIDDGMRTSSEAAEEIENIYYDLLNNKR